MLQFQGTSLQYFASAALWKSQLNHESLCPTPNFSDDTGKKHVWIIFLLL